MQFMLDRPAQRKTKYLRYKSPREKRTIYPYLYINILSKRLLSGGLIIICIYTKGNEKTKDMIDAIIRISKK